MWRSPQSRASESSRTDRVVSTERCRCSRGDSSFPGPRARLLALGSRARVRPSNRRSRGLAREPSPMATPDMSNLTADIEAGLRSAQRPGTARSSLAASSLNSAIRDGVRARETQGKVPPFAVLSAHQPRLDGADAAVPIAAAQLTESGDEADTAQSFSRAEPRVTGAPESGVHSAVRRTPPRVRRSPRATPCATRGSPAQSLPHWQGEVQHRSRALPACHVDGYTEFVNVPQQRGRLSGWMPDDKARSDPRTQPERTK